MNPSELTALLCATTGVFVISGIAVGRLLRRLTGSRGVFLAGRLLQACCVVGILICLTGLFLRNFR